MSLPLLVLTVLLVLTPTQAWVAPASCRELHRLSFLQSSSTSAVESAKKVVVPAPEIKWTVPGMKRGWKDDEGNWWDEDGIRNGPPMNYWRQRADERYFAKDVKVMEQVLDASDLAEVDMKQLSLQVTRPLMNNKLMGVWAPLVRNGKKVGGRGESSDLLETPYTITVRRSGLRRLGNTTGYGTFDAHFDKGERAEVTVLGSSFTLVAVEGNEVQEIGNVNGDEPLTFGNISCLSDYLLVMKNEDGSLREFWTRAEPIKSVSKEDAARIREEFEAAQATKE